MVEALRGWKWLAPSFSRRPLAWELVCGIAMVLHAPHKERVAVGVLICVVFCLRLGELLCVQDRSVTPPLLRWPFTQWTISLHEHEGEHSRLSKARSSDDVFRLRKVKGLVRWRGFQAAPGRPTR